MILEREEEKKRREEKHENLQRLLSANDFAAFDMYDSQQPPPVISAAVGLTPQSGEAGRQDSTLATEKGRNALLGNLEPTVLT
jgi:hypothetical protein